MLNPFGEVDDIGHGMVADVLIGTELAVFLGLRCLDRPDGEIPASDGTDGFDGCLFNVFDIIGITVIVRKGTFLFVEGEGILGVQKHTVDFEFSFLGIKGSGIEGNDIIGVSIGDAVDLQFSLDGTQGIAVV